MMKKISIIIYVFLCSFSFSHASVEISEIMYNPEGSDTNREWIEIYNTGNSIEIENWYFYEGDTYHGLSPDNFTALAGGERALIVKDVSIAKSELGLGIKYIKSSFSLKNTGEEIVIADENKDHIYTYTYNPETGADGDEKSLQRISSSWFAGIPSPGIENSISSGDSNNSDINTDSKSKDESKELHVTYAAPYHQAYLDFPDVIVAQSDFNYKLGVFYIKEGKKTRELDGYYYVNFGNGDYLESRERIDQNYRYRNSGNYIVAFEYYGSKLSFDNGDDPDAYIQKNISVIPHSLKIIAVNAFDGVVIENNTSKIIDLSAWKIIWNNKKYQFPRMSYINSKNKMYILYKTLGFSPDVKSENPIQLLSNTGKPVSYFPEVKRLNKYVAKKVVTKKSKTSDVSVGKSDNNLKEEVFDFKNLKDADLDFFGNSTDTYLEKYLKDNPNKLKVNFGEENVASFSTDKTEKTKNNSLYYTLGAFVLMLGTGRFAKYKNNDESKIEVEDFGTIEIIE